MVISSFLARQAAYLHTLDWAAGKLACIWGDADLFFPL